MARSGGPFAHAALVLAALTVAPMAEASFVRVPPPRLDPETILACPLSAGNTASTGSAARHVVDEMSWAESDVSVRAGATLAAVAVLVGAVIACGRRRQVEAGD
jgi:hypothetical protein